MQFTSIISLVVIATGVFAAPQGYGSGYSCDGGQPSGQSNTFNPFSGFPSGSNFNVNTGSCQQNIFCISPSSTTGLINIGGDDQDVCDSVGGAQYCCDQPMTSSGLFSVNELNNICGVSLTRRERVPQ